jgi:RND family efflux transporter MFP subunit
MNDKNKIRMMIIGGTVLGLLVAGVLVSGGMKKAKIKRSHADKVAENAAPKPVDVETVRLEKPATQRSFPGIIQASDESALSFRVGGPLVQVNVKQGEPVKKGDLLMQIDPRDFEDRIRSLEAQLAGAQALLQNAERDYQRIAELFAEKVVPQSDFDRALSARDSAAAAVENVNAGLQIARHALEDTSLRAPYAGTVSAQLVENSQMVAPGQVVLQFHTIQKLEVTVSVSENEMVQLSLNAETPASVSFPAITGKTCEARLKEWSSSANPLTRTYAVTFEFNAPTGYRILPGMSAELSWLPPPRPRAW